jgi:hypothetical protein
MKVTGEVVVIDWLVVHDVLLYWCSLVDRIVQVLDELLTRGDVVLTWVEAQPVTVLVFSDDGHPVDLSNGHGLTLTFTGTTIEDRVLEDDLVSYFVGCFLLWGCFDYFHWWCWLMSYCISVR